MANKIRWDDALSLLKAISAGGATVSLNGKKVVEVDAVSRNFDLDISLFTSLGVRPAKFLLGDTSDMLSVLRMARKLAKAKWRFTVTQEGKRILQAGRDTNVLTGNLSANPLRLLRLRKLL